MDSSKTWEWFWGYLLSLPREEQGRLASSIDGELVGWLPFTPSDVQEEVLEFAPGVVVESLEKRRVRYNKVGGGFGYMPAVSPEVAGRLRERRGQRGVARGATKPRVRRAKAKNEKA